MADLEIIKRLIEQASTVEEADTIVENYLGTTNIKEKIDFLNENFDIITLCSESDSEIDRYTELLESALIVNQT